MTNNNKSISRTIVANIMRPTFQGVIAGIIIFLGIMFLAYQLFLTKNAGDQLRLVNQSTKIRYEIERIFNQNISSLASFQISKQKAANIENFRSTAEDILLQNPYIESIALLPGGKYEQILPLNDSTQKNLGLDLLKNVDPRLIARARQGIDRNQITLAGPFPNSQYDSVVTFIYPVFFDKEFWGFCTATAPLSKILRPVDSLASLGLNVSLTNIDPVSGQPYPIYASTNYKASGNKNTHTEKILHNNWQLHVSSPITGWFKILVVPFLVSLLIAALVGSYVNGLIGAKRQLGGAEVALKRFDHKFKSIFENAPMGIAQIDSNSRIIKEVNKKFCELSGLKSNELIGKKLSQIVPVSFYDESRSEFEQSLITGPGQLQKKYEYEGKNGKTAWVNFTIKPIVDADGKVNTTLLVVEDITEAELAKKALIASEVRYRNLFKNSPISLFAQDYSEVKIFLAEKGLLNKSRDEIRTYFSKNLSEFKECCLKIKTLNFNDAALGLYGIKDPAELTAILQNLFDSELGWDNLFEALTLVSNGQTKHTRESNMTTPRGHLSIMSEWTVAPGSEDSFDHVVSALVDITELKTVQKKLENTNKLVEVSEKHYRSLFEDSPIALWEQDFSALKTYFVENDLMGKSYDEVFNYFVCTPNAFEECFALFKIYDVNKSAVELYDAADKTELMNNVKFLLASPASMEYTILALTSLSNGILSSKHETTIFTLSEEIKHIDYRWNVAPGYEDDFGRVIVAMSDITQLKKAEMKAQETAYALQRSQERFKTLFDDSPIALWEEDFSGVKDYLVEKDLWQKPEEVVTRYFKESPEELISCMKELKLISANKEALKSYNANSLEEAIAVLKYALHQPESHDAFLMQLVVLSTNALKLRKELRTVDEKGETIYLDLNWNVLPGYEESLGRVLVSTNDITQIKKSETEIKAARARLETIINTIDGIVWTAEPQTLDFTFVSNNSVNITGYPKSAWTNKFEFCRNYIHENDVEEIMLECTKKVANGIPHVSEYRLLTKTEGLKWFRESINFIKQNEKIVAVIGIIVDITDLKNAKDNLQQSLDIVSKQNKQLLQFSYIVSHNLRSHIGNISSLCELVIDKDTNVEEKEIYVKHLHNISEILSDTMEGLNKVTQIQTDINLSVKPLNLKEFINRTTTILSNVIKTKKMTINTQVNDDVMVNHYQPYLESILLCFISNAVKYSSPERKPVLNITFDERKQILAFADNGIGIDLELHGDKIFGLFKKFTTHPDSRGIGLYIAKNQIEVLGGRVTVESKINEGTTFKIYLNG